MKPPSQWAAADGARAGGAQELAAALTAARQRTLALLAVYEQALGPTLRVPFSTQLNPPLWEVGHVGWFQDYWIARNRQRALGVACDPEHQRPSGRLPAADALYNSSVVAQETRWQLPLPDLAATRAYLEAGLIETLALQAQTAEQPADLYFFRLVLFHEQMHAEAATYMAQALDIPLPAALLAGAPSPSPALIGQPPAASLCLPAGEWSLGYAQAGFAFDNELPTHRVHLSAFAVDPEAVTWQRYLPFVAAGGYEDARWWSAEGWQWREANTLGAPRYLRQVDTQWQHRVFGQWQPLPLAAAAVHLSWFEADAWCRWAGRRLPEEAEWEYAALTDARLQWGEVWEWTASRFLPFPGFCAHPYRDYSAPWFGSRRVLRGGSCATAPEMVHPRYRNFFTLERNDIYAGFRSCAIDR